MSQTNGQETEGDMIIFKVQISIVSSSHIRDVYSYNKDRSITNLQPLTKELNSYLKGALKSFHYGIVKDKKIKLIKEAPWQSW